MKDYLEDKSPIPMNTVYKLYKEWDQKYESDNWVEVFKDNWLWVINMWLDEGLRMTVYECCRCQQPGTAVEHPMRATGFECDSYDPNEDYFISNWAYNLNDGHYIASEFKEYLAKKENK